MSLTQEQLESLNLNFTPEPAEIEAKTLIKLPPIKQVPKFRTVDELAAFLNSDEIRHYRPQAKIVRVVESRSADSIHTGTMFRKRMSKQKNTYKQVIKPANKHLPPLLLLDD